MTGTPVRRRHSPAVYRRRRLVALLALVGVVAVIWLLIARPWSAPAAQDGGPQPLSTADSLPAPSSAGSDATGGGTVEGATPGATPSTTPTARACVAGDIIVEPLTDQDTYTGDQHPQFSIKLTNNGPECTLNVGTSLQAFTVSSGDDVWWRSTDCQSEPSDMVVTLAAGQSVTSAQPLSWDRTRSSIDTCGDPAARPHAPSGGASYHLSVEIGGIPSTQSKQFLLY
jgi:hypothetical protein